MTLKCISFIVEIPMSIHIILQVNYNNFIEFKKLQRAIMIESFKTIVFLKSK